jgi:glycosyltransferase involved in cell wall biosynthesis
MPAYNEEQGVGLQIERIRQVMAASGCEFEIIVVDDGSTDGTAGVAREHDVHLIRKRYNRGYGAALKTGIAASKCEWILIIDADGTYPVDAIPQLLKSVPEFDMVVAARIGKKVHIPLVRRPMKWVIGRLANYLAGQSIPDLNSGMRIFRKTLAAQFEHLLPSGFSFTTTITMALLLNEYDVLFIPIDYDKRVGFSKVRSRHVYDFLLAILRTALCFNPLRFFLPFGLLFFLAGLIKSGFDAHRGTLSGTSAVLLLAALIIWAVGLLSDQISRLGLATRLK